MKKNLIIIFFGVLIGTTAAYFLFQTGIKKNIEPIKEEALKIIEKPLEKYSFERLKEHTFQPSEIVIGEEVKKDPNFTSYKFYFYVDEIAGSPRKKVSGLMNVPAKEGIYPVIVMFRGYVDKEKFTSGEGTRRGGELLAQNGFITLAPDFLGFGESDETSRDSLESRFQTYPTAITLLNSVSNLNTSIEESEIKKVKADPIKIGIWGHSNGGHISLSSLAITGKEYPTVLWNPVTKPFPYSIFAFMDEQEDDGKIMRRMIARFEEDYDIDKYSPSKYYKWINAPIQLHQGSIDEAVPLRWSNDFETQMKDLDKEVEYFVYPGDDHNFLNGSYTTVFIRTLQFYKTNLK